MQLLSLLSLVLATTAAASDPQTDSADSSTRRSEAELEQDGWILLDAVIAQAGDEVVTLLQLDTFLTERLGPDATQEMALANAMRALETLETIQLEIQAGEDLGPPVAEIERSIQASLDARRRDSSVREYLDYLGSQGLDPREAPTSQSNDYYRFWWSQEQVGERVVGGGRIVRDSYLRPGTLRAFYHENQDLLGTPPSVRFQRIFLSAQPGEEVEVSQDMARDVIQRLAEGESFDTLLLDLGEEDPLNSLQPWQDLPDLVADSPDLAAFARRAAEGSIYPEPLPAFVTSSPAEQQAAPAGWFIYRLNDRIAGSPPPFDSRDTQAQLRSLLKDRWSSSALTQARAKLAASSFHWRHARFGGGPSPQAAGTPIPYRQP